MFSSLRWTLRSVHHDRRQREAKRPKTEISGAPVVAEGNAMLLLCAIVAAGRPPRLQGEIWISKRPNPRLRRWSDQVFLKGVGAINIHPGHFLWVDDDRNHDSLKHRIAYDKRLEIQSILPLESKERWQSSDDIGAPPGRVTHGLGPLRLEVEVPVTLRGCVITRPEYLFEVFRARAVVHHKA